MKHLFTTIFSLLLFTGVYAQGLSAGLRTGVGHTIDVAQLKAGVADNTWDKEFFIRYETTGKFALESSAVQYNTSYNPLEGVRGCGLRDNMTEEPVGTIFNNSIIDLSMSAQYEITCGAMQNCPILSKIRSFIGVNTAFSYQKSFVTMYDRLYVDNSIRETKGTYTSLVNPQVGLSQVLIYDLKHFYITTNASFMTNPWGIGQLDYYENRVGPNSKLSLRIGAGYRF